MSTSESSTSQNISSAHFRLLCILQIDVHEGGISKPCMHSLLKWAALNIYTEFVWFTWQYWQFPATLFLFYHMFATS